MKPSTTNWDDCGICGKTLEYIPGNPHAYPRGAHWNPFGDGFAHDECARKKAAWIDEDPREAEMAGRGPIAQRLHDEEYADLHRHDQKEEVKI